MRLADLQTGEKGVIVRVNGHGSFRKRLIEMGFIQGKEVTVVLNAPLKDPIEYEIIGYKVSLRREEARNIEVVTEQEAREALVSDEHLQALPGDLEEEERLNRALAHVAEERHHVIRVALVGNPNCGKTSLFNIASGSHEHVGNYSGVTVDAKEGHFEHKGYKITLVDLPGTYSLSAYSPEELYVRKNLIDAMPDVVVNVVDASNIERNLYLTTQIIDMNLRTVMALNMYDELQAKGDRLDTKQLGHLLGIPVCPTVSRDGQGIPELFDTVIKIYEQSDPKLARHIHINHGAEIEKSIDRIKALIASNEEIRSKYSTRYLAIKYLETDKDIEALVEKLPNRNAIIAAREEEAARIEALLHTNPESAIVDAKYAFIQGALSETYEQYREDRPRRTLTDRIDAVVTHRWLAFPIFIVLLWFIFWATFTIGQYPMDWIDWLVGKFGDFVGSYMKEGWLKDLVVDGVIAGVGSVLVFLPNIMILYFFISIMEDSGYMARAAFIVDKLMHRIGLHGKSFIPMVMGFGCNVPAIMATRSIESRKSRLVTIAIIPFMSCAGRLPIFVLFAGAFFPHNAATALLGIYLLGVVLAIASAKIMAKFVKDDDLPFVMELPPYRVPTGKAIWRHTWEKGKQYLEKMATTILFFSVAIWFLGYFPRHEGQTTAYQQEHSYIGMVGKAVEPALEPLGFNWKMDVGLLAGVGAKELVISSLGVMYAQDGAEFEGDENDTQLQAALKGDIPTAAALAYMVFVLLYFPCIATFVAIKNETGKWRWAILICLYTMLVAWVFGWIAFRLGLLIWP
ncbi:MAG: ferrous iron transport protein B [Bacteroidales bacterium]|nr:ferrous iron transport protein B [Bacteroidales bacterium]MBR1678740.1 ferrous iron transport protein B [Bacteroidales bacterium]